MKAIIIDDEILARDVIRGYLKEVDDIEIVSECENGFQGLKEISELKPDIIFLDIQMPKLTGFEMLELLDYKPMVIFTTAYDEYAIKAFEANAVDYLLKPFSANRFFESLSKANKRFRHMENEHEKLFNTIEAYKATEGTIDRIAVKTNNNIIKIIPVDDIIKIEAEDDYVMIYSGEGRYLKYATMNYYEAHLPSNEFLRVHRSNIINLKKIKHISPYGKETVAIAMEDESFVHASKSGTKKLKDVLGI